MLEQLDVTAIRPSPSNPRKTFRTDELDELATSIASHGVLEPIMVRPLPPEEANGITHEIVFGERRWRAAKQAGLAELPAIVRELDDKQVLEIQLIENAKRSDIHPLEEADGYRRLHEDHGYSVEDLAAKVGKSPAFVRSRMKLCGLVTEARTALLEEQILPSVAVLLARIPHEDIQRKALERMLPQQGEGLVPASEAAQIIRDDFMLRLEQAPFDRADAALVPVAGACTSCPKRTGAQAELFADVDSPDLCTDPKCHRAKVDAHWQLLQIRSKETGQKLLSEAEAKKVFHYGHVSYDAPYYEAERKIFVGASSNKPKSAKALAGKENVVLARTPEGQIVELVPRKLVDQAQREARGQESSAADDDYKKAEARRRREAELKKREERALAGVVIEKASRRQIGDEVLRLVIEAFADDRSWCLDGIIARRELDVSKDKHASGRQGRAIAKLAAELKGSELFALLVEVSLQVAGDAIKKRIFEAYGIDDKAIAAKVRAEAKTEKAAKAAKKKPAPKATPKKAAAKKTTAKKK